MRIQISKLVPICLLALFGSSVVHAATVTYDYTATVTSSGVGVVGIDIGDTVTGTLTYSDNYPASTFTTTSSQYDATGAILTMNGVFADLDRLTLSNSSAIRDQFQIIDTSSAGGSFFLLRGTNALIADATVIPLDLDFGEVTSSQVLFDFQAGSGFGDGTVTATLTSFSVQVVPVPAAAWLFGSGLLGLISMARRKKAA
jgi:hypothetical protein